MEKFNLEEALKRPERVIYRKDGKPLEWHYFKDSIAAKIVAVTENGLLCHYDENGKLYSIFGTDIDYNLDLFLMPREVKIYKAVYKADLSPYTCKTIEEAFELCKNNQYVKSIIEICMVNGRVNAIHTVWEYPKI